MNKAVIFPGQGSQFVGMGNTHYTDNELFASLVDHACEILDIDLKAIMFNGPEDTLKQTEFTQPAIFLHSIALFRTLDIKPDMVAGHSLGEFSALVAANAMDFDDALRIVRKRGQLMQQAGQEHPGTMAAIIGMSDEDVESVCKKASDTTGNEVVPANYNCPGQLVISGYTEAVETAVQIAKEGGARMATLLPVSGAFHSSLMKSAYVGLESELNKVEIRHAECPVYSNFTAKPVTQPDQIRENVLNQLLNPVKWTQSLEAMIADGADNFIEVGPGKVLQGLVKRTNRKVEINGFQ